LADVFLSLGSNLGDRESNVRTALEMISAEPGIRVMRVSSLYETEPIGMSEQPDFINAVALLETEVPPMELLRILQGIESKIGRARNIHWGPRVIDLDILLYGKESVDAAVLMIPHPRMMTRAFVMAPLAEIAPDLELPDGRKPGEVLADLQDQRVVKTEGNG
jgi:2-amino-4-hydroxy-6-hydroxymethyldihydropteridine diphosphokinase